jgi:hypothetical protein
VLHNESHPKLMSWTSGLWASCPGLLPQFVPASKSLTASCYTALLCVRWCLALFIVHHSVEVLVTVTGPNSLQVTSDCMVLALENINPIKGCPLLLQLPLGLGFPAEIVRVFVGGTHTCPEFPPPPHRVLCHEASVLLGVSRNLTVTSETKLDKLCASACFYLS